MHMWLHSVGAQMAMAQANLRASLLVAGATAVCIVCYVIPVALHLKLYLSKSGYQLLEAAESPQLAEPLLQVRLLSELHGGLCNAA